MSWFFFFLPNGTRLRRQDFAVKNDRRTHIFYSPLLLNRCAKNSYPRRMLREVWVFFPQRERRNWLVNLKKKTNVFILHGKGGKLSLPTLPFSSPWKLKICDFFRIEWTFPFNRLWSEWFKRAATDRISLDHGITNHESNKERVCVFFFKFFFGMDPNLEPFLQNPTEAPGVQ